MLNDKKIVVVMPAFNAAATLRKTYDDVMSQGIVDQVIVVDDASDDNTSEVAATLPGAIVRTHPENRGYGANQKTCYKLALDSGADIVVMVHPDYQYDPRVIQYAVGFITLQICDIVMGSRIRTRRETLDGGMPLYKYISNRLLTTFENIGFGQNLGDFHSGFRIYNRQVLETINIDGNSDDFIFDTELLAQAIYCGFRVGDIPIPTRYEPDSSSINFQRSLKYGIQCVWVVTKYILQVSGLCKFKVFANTQAFDDKSK
ncbi:putative glycosyl transferase (group 2 family protein) [Desulforapulum autotrophicum HRM2]|uniref:Glycosyl transferase (Group 2 family protein) n=2 Tax=Desulforapulum autotrophicum TaxID=2296 RepID=C0QK50_DESAH|nr:putative glycosyl transferase (group 2 family protein) [Desulforapulum autotrophicum HRM2]